MMTSDVETSQAFNYALSPHERCIRGDNNNNKTNKNIINNNNSNNNVRNIHVALEKNLNVFVRDHLENVTVDNGDDSTATKAVHECSSSKSYVSKTEEPQLSSSSSSIGSDPDPNSTHPGQQPDKNTSRKETMPASSLVQIWEARTTQQPPNQIDSRTSSSGSTVLESSDSFTEEPIKEPETIQPIQEGSNEDDKEEEIESDSQSVSGEKEREGVRVMDIIRKLSSDTETTTGNNDNGSSSNDNGKEVQTTTTTTTETRSFPQVSCSPRIRGRQAFADLLVQMMRDREKELVCLLDRHCVSKFTHRGRIQSTLRIRCYERCIAIQDKYRSKSLAAGTDLNRAGGSDLNRSPRGSGVMHLLKEKTKTNYGNTETAGAQSSSVSSRGRVMDKDSQKSLEKKVVEETMEKIDVKEVQEVVSAVETAKKAVLSELVENKNGLKKATGETIKKEVGEKRGEKRETMAQEVVSAVETAKKAVLSELVENKNGLKKSTGETIKKEVGEKRGEKRETTAQEVVSAVETAKKAVLSELVEKKNGLKKSTGETIKKEVSERRGEKRETMAQEVVSAVETAKKAVLSELVENKNGLKKATGETIKKEIGEKRGEKRETMAQEVVSALETAKKAVLNELVENKNGLKKSAGETIKKDVGEKRGEQRETMAQEVVYAVKAAKKAVLSELVENKYGLKKATGETIKKEVEERSCEKRETMEKHVAKKGLEGGGEKETAKKTILSESAEGKSGSKKPEGETLQKEPTKGRGDEGEAKEKSIAKDKVQGNALVGIAEKVNRWNSEEKMNRSRWTENGKTESKANTERVDKNDESEEATRRTINVQSGEKRKEKENCVSVETKSREIGDPQPGTTAQEGEKVVQETTTKSDLSETRNNKNNGLKKPTERQSREVKEMEEESVEGNTLMGIAEKVKMWNSRMRKSRRRYSMDKGKGKGKTGKPNTERNEVLQEASRKIINEISNTTSKETVEKVVGTQEIKDQRVSSREIMCESEEKVRRKKEEEVSSGEAKSKDITEVKIMSSQEVIIPAQESACHGSPERGKEINPSPQGEEMFILQNLKDKSSKEIDGNKNIIEEVSREKNPSQQDEEVKEVAMEFANGWDENEEEDDDDDDYEDYYGEISTDWIYDIARPRSYWEELRKERYLEVLNAETDKKDICNLIQSRTVSNFLTSDLRQKIDNLMTSLVHNHLSVPIHQEEEEEEEEECVEECSARNQEDNETEEEPEKTDLEAASDTILDACSQTSERSSTLMISWSFRDQDIDKDHEPTTSLSLPEPSSASSQTEMQMISDLREQVEQLQREMLELRNTVKSCTDMQLHFQKSATQDSGLSGSSEEQRVETKNPLKRKCCVCSEMPVDSLLYRCGHMCTCLKCAHELQWSSKKCPICMAPIVDVVRAFLDA